MDSAKPVQFSAFARAAPDLPILRSDDDILTFDDGLPDTRIAPMLALLSDSVPEGEGWAYEFKWDGVRAIVFVEGGRVRATTRNDKDLAATFPELRAVGEFLGSRSAVLDGELVALGADGYADFNMLQNFKSAEQQIHYYVFDILALKGLPD